MKLLYNLSVCQPVGNVKRHGGGIYGEIVFKRIVERGLPVSCCYDGNKWLNPDVKRIIEDNSVDCFDITNNPIEDIVRKNGFDTLYTPIFIGLESYNACRIIATIHGLRSVEMPIDDYFHKYRSPFKEKIKFLLSKYFSWYWNKRTRWGYEIIGMKNNLDFVTVSYHSQAGFKAFFPEYFKDKDIPVFYSPSTIGNDVINKKEYQDKYFLLVSAGIPAKNNLRAVIALDKLFSVGMLNDYNVRITGMKDGIKYKYQIKNPDRFKFMGYVSDHELHQLYHDAYCFIYPSLNEGFGYPAVEAMSYGVPVLASPFSSITEICGNAALYFNPFSVEEIMNRIIMITNLTKHDRLSDLAKKRYQIVYDKQNKDLDLLIDYIYNISEH